MAEMNLGEVVLRRDSENKIITQSGLLENKVRLEYFSPTFPGRPFQSDLSVKCLI